MELAKVLLEKLECRLVVFTGIEGELRHDLEAEVSLVPREALLVPTRVHLHVAVPVREPLRGDIPLQVLDMEDDVVTKLDIDLVVLVHL